jgi:predicted pyridoxine 5'-phosphate oxidase superfamily flavin-nucleotide-binding protein
VQAERGSRAAYGRMEERGGFESEVTAELAAFLADIDTAFLATANAAGQPYVQHRGGPKGFVRPVDQGTIGFADFVGNRQYVTTGNLRENDRVCLLLIDYGRRARVKLWGRARVVPIDDPRAAGLPVAGYPGRVEQAILIAVEAWDANCPRHIPQKLDASAVETAVQELQARIARLEKQNRELRAALPDRKQR